ncbi:MAG TPA: hypothetical protein VIY51_21345 [Xanthobacteraceae bacterium]
MNPKKEIEDALRKVDSTGPALAALVQKRDALESEEKERSRQVTKLNNIIDAFIKRSRCIDKYVAVYELVLPCILVMFLAGAVIYKSATDRNFRDFSGAHAACTCGPPDLE